MNIDISNNNFLECKLVNTWGIMYNCDIFNPDENNIKSKDYLNYINWDNIKPGTKLYIGLGYLRYFIDNFLNKLKVPIFLLTGHGDEDASLFKELADNPLIIHWFSQNADFNHDKLTKIPIGLDYHTLLTSKTPHSWGDNNTPLEQEKHLLSIASLNIKKNIDCYANYRCSVYCRKYTNDRIESIDEIPENLVYYEPQSLLRIVSWIKQTHYQFVISPHGNGLDCHRTYEALALGCYPIVKTSPLDSLFYELPVLIVNKWSDVSLELLQKTADEFKNKSFNMKKMTLEYWNNIVNENVNRYIIKLFNL
jgi:hypothetical protein